MAPLRRYLRITKYSVLECRIYLDNPALAQSWLLNPRNPVLPRVLESIRPLVLPKLIEERERARKKGTKNKGVIKDVLVEEDFEVSLFLTETETRHSLLYKHRKARDKTQTRLVSNSTKLTGASLDAPIDVDDGGGSSGNLVVDIGDSGHLIDDGDGDVVITAATASAATADDDDNAPPNLLRQDSDDEAAHPALQSIPEIRTAPATSEGTRRSKRQRQAVVQVDDSDDQESLFGGGDEDDGDSNGDGDFADTTDGPPAKRSRSAVEASKDQDEDEEEDDNNNSKKQKLAMDVIYEGFAIYGRVLCLVIKRRALASSNTLASAMSGPQPKNRSSSSRAAASTTAARPAGHASMENWIASTQAPPDAMEADVP